MAPRRERTLCVASSAVTRLNRTRNYGGKLDAAILTYGITRRDWLGLNRVINPVVYPISEISTDAWAALPDFAAIEKFLTANQNFGDVPDRVEVVAEGASSAMIAAMPNVLARARVTIPTLTCNKQAAIFMACYMKVQQISPSNVHVLVHPNNPDGKIWQTEDVGGPTIIDERLCDVMPEESLIAKADLSSCIVHKSFREFWGVCRSVA